MRCKQCGFTPCACGDEDYPDDPEGEAFELLISQIIVSYANLLIEDDDDDSEVVAIWPSIQKFFRVGFNLILDDRPRLNSPIDIVIHGEEVEVRAG